MYSKSKKSMAATKQPSQDEILARRTQIYMQKRETFALNALNKLLEKRPVKSASNKKAIHDIIITAVNLADELLIALYKTEENENTETNDSENNQ